MNIVTHYDKLIDDNNDHSMKKITNITHQDTNKIYVKQKRKDIFLTIFRLTDKITLIIGKEDTMSHIISNCLRRRCRCNLL
ncbi:hypothetical protein acsn021_34050 [Anaerocolumna cellulosilytica]|uniref:Uncharacterized protein n=1 Tax=Anaerocolumna cellulosilytica TaxID=433286 RepID=A0A6S6R193_9FIRM|nr:hypothetical protein [Anaerocolumna cellulosilytica]MBB5196770.1 hypothetical protein [Anaerocolumna cellulosilytica]BCJ95836.1 hypothetical protein acsn021_34050 [Anaerocolumna cellulosilytica]